MSFLVHVWGYMYGPDNCVDAGGEERRKEEKEKRETVRGREREEEAEARAELERLRKRVAELESRLGIAAKQERGTRGLKFLVRVTSV